MVGDKLGKKVKGSWGQGKEEGIGKGTKKMSGLEMGQKESERYTGLLEIITFNVHTTVF